MKHLYAVLLVLGLQSPALGQYWQQPAAKNLHDIVHSNNESNELFQLESHPSIYILDFKSPLAQANALNRIGIFVEMKDAPRDTLMTLAEAKAHLEKHRRTWEGFYAAHDYRSVDLARFFNLAQKMKLALTPEEQEVLQILLHHQIIEQFKGGFRAVGATKVLLSLSENPGESLTYSHQKRLWALRHELRHGYFFTSENYRQRAIRYWTRMPHSYKLAFTQYLGNMGYETENAELMVNEFQAYLTESPVSALKGVGLSSHTLQGLKRSLIKALSSIKLTQ